MGIDPPDSKDKWRAEQALAQADAGDCQWFTFNYRSGLYELRSHEDVAPRFHPLYLIAVPPIGWKKFRFKAASFRRP